MKKSSLLAAFILMFCVSLSYAENDKATPEDVYNLVLKGHEVLTALGDESLPAFNDPKGEFIYKDTYILIQDCATNRMIAHPFALDKLKDVDLSTFSFNKPLCEAGEKPGGAWTEYMWPKPGATEPSRKISYSIRAEGTPYTIIAGIYSDSAKVEDLNKTLH